MAGHYAHNAYLHAKVQVAADPKRLILMLYEGALEHLALAREGLEEQNTCKHSEHLSRAVAIVSELYTSLNPTVLDESMIFLSGLYQAILVGLAQVAVTHDVQTLQLAFRYLERLKQIWEHDVMGLQLQTATAVQQPVTLTVPANSRTQAASLAYDNALPGLSQRLMSV